MKTTKRSFAKAANLLWIFLSLLPATLWAQTTTYHLHAALSITPGVFQLQTAGPSTAITTFQSGPLVVPGEYQVVGFDTQAGVPNVYGYFPSGSSVSFSLWMQTNRSGSNAIYPKAKVYVNNPSGPLLCSASASTALTATPQKFNLSCTTTANVTLQQSDRLYLWVGVTQSGSATATLRALLNVEGTLNGNYDSQVTVPTAVVPTITNLSQPNGLVGTQITISGTNFGPIPDTVKFNEVVASPSTWNNTSIVVPVPPGAVTGDVTVTVAGVRSNGVVFTLTPVINGLSSTSRAIGAAVTITGINFGALQGSSTATFNGTSVSPTGTTWSNTSIVTTVPNGASSGNVVVAVNGIASNGMNFTVVPPPAISTLSATTGAAGASITITGSNFRTAQGDGLVEFNGWQAPVTSWSDTSIVAAVPNGATTGNVVVVQSGVPSNGINFTVTSDSISSVSPPSGPPGTLVTILGVNFGSAQGSSTVTFNGTAVTPTWSNTGTSIQFSVPNGATPSTSNSVVVTVGGIPSNPAPFTTTPSITGLSLTAGPVDMGFIISGTNFGKTQGNSTVTLGGTPLTVISNGWSDNQITVQVPTAAKTGDVVVTVNSVPNTVQKGTSVTFTVSTLLLPCAK